MSKLTTSERVSLLLAQVEIYKLKADDYVWQVHVPDPVKKKLDNVLTEINKLTKEK